MKYFLMPIVFLLLSLPLFAQESAKIQELEQKIEQLEQRLSTTSDETHSLEDTVGHLSRLSGVVLFLAGAFCALWAQNTGNNPWLWFFIGAFLNVVAILIVLRQNAKRVKRTA